MARISKHHILSGLFALLMACEIAGLAVGAWLLVDVFSAPTTSWRPIVKPIRPPRLASSKTGVAPLACPPPISQPAIDPREAIKELLPSPPEALDTLVYTGDDLRRVPQLRFEAAPKEELTAEQWRRRIGRSVAAALYFNAKEDDGFLKAMLKDRPDLAGVPFAMGDACRTKGFRARAFKRAVDVANIAARAGYKEAEMGHLWCRQIATKQRAIMAGPPEDVDRALIAARRQRMAAADVRDRRSTVQYFAGVSHPEATRELTRMAVFSSDQDVRNDALKALSVRRGEDATAILVEALNYPWPAVARNAAEAIAKLDRKELMPNLIDMLDAADPRGPKTERANGKEVTTARELVRVNHLSNCLLCHAPAGRSEVADGILIAEVPVPTEPLPGGAGYGTARENRARSNLLVRIDVTYLRQDFSAVQAVDEKGPWPAMQRFDFVVRNRELTAAEAEELRDRLQKREPGVLSPYQEAAVNALREMTGRDFGAKAEPWRRHLKLKGL